jgi:hypothetical protein
MARGGGGFSMGFRCGGEASGRRTGQTDVAKRGELPGVLFVGCVGRTRGMERGWLGGFFVEAGEKGRTR